MKNVAYQKFQESQALHARQRNQMIDAELDDLLDEGQQDGDSIDSKTETTTSGASTAKEVVSTTPITKSGAENSAIDYSFSLREVAIKNYRGVDNDTLLQLMHGLHNFPTFKARPYSEVRLLLCAMSVVMNERGMVAPAFRPARKLPVTMKKGAVATLISAEQAANDLLMLRDRQIIDLHWLYCRGRRSKLPKKQFEDLFIYDEFNWGTAEEIAVSNWNAVSKSKFALALTHHEQLQMAVLRDKSFGKFVSDAKSKMNGVIDQQLRKYRERRPNAKGSDSDFKNLWLAQALCDDNSLVKIAQIYGWITGKPPLAKSTLSEKLKSLEKRLS